MAAKHIIFGISIGVLVLVSIILIAVSFSALQPNQVGLDLNRNNQKIDDSRLYQSGTHFLGLGHGFTLSLSLSLSLFKFGTTLRTVRFCEDCHSPTLTARSKDGLSLRMDVNFEYKLRVEIKGLVELYSKFGTSYEEQYIRTSRDVIRLVCGEFVAQEYSFNRSLVGVRIKEALNHTLYDLQASVESVNILNIDLPAAFAQAIQESELVKQEKERVQFEKESADITANTMIIEAEKRAELRVSEALTNKTNRLLQKDAEANGITTRYVERNTLSPYCMYLPSPLLLLLSLSPLSLSLSLFTELPRRQQHTSC
eukprot:TRINITY_DN1010_c0_g1_i6.p1 TRINITY_DN1010_c0_g1~~TRINITY_DN1010_c0_g1_i6.p1  ORF type:complete len:312 (+),score=63.20 TRINITY_DN1010_c0_g1_i6:337-1272(+)